MASSKEIILSAIRKHTLSQELHPDISAMLTPQTFEDKVDHFGKVLTAVGGRLVLDDGTKTLAEHIHELFPEATRFISDMEIAGISCTHPRDVHEPTEMNGADLTILHSPLGVCENACVWVEQKDEWRAHLFIAEQLLILLDRQTLVNNMHEAYAWVEQYQPQTPYSGFISGPSKTADIEQALVMGAHGARGLVVLLH